MRISETRWLLSEEAVKSEDGRDLTAATTRRKVGVGDGSGRGERGGWFAVGSKTFVCLSVRLVPTSCLLWGESPFWEPRLWLRWFGLSCDQAPGERMRVGEEYLGLMRVEQRQICRRGIVKKSMVSLHPLPDSPLHCAMGRASDQRAAHKKNTAFGFQRVK